MGSDIHISLPAETLVTLGFLRITNSAFTMLLVMAGLVFFFAMVTRRLALVPGGLQNLAETIVEWLLELVEGAAGKNLGRRIFPLVATLFIFIITANYAGLLPFVGTVGFYREVHEAAPHAQVVQVASVNGQAAASPAATPQATREFIPFLRSPNADLNMTIAMALLAVGIVQYAGVAAHGVWGYLKELFTPIFLAPIHLIGEVSRIISLSARLFGNIFGGEVLVTVIYSLTKVVIPVAFLGIELLFGFIQALIFSLLTMSYIMLAVAGHGGHGDHGDAEETEHGVARLAAGETGAHMPA